MGKKPESDVIRLVERENMKKQEMLHVVCAVVVSVSIEICRNQWNPAWLMHEVDSLFRLTGYFRNMQMFGALEAWRGSL